jgi:hypothetical protein
LLLLPGNHDQVGAGVCVHMLWGSDEGAPQLLLLLPKNHDQVGAGVWACGGGGVASTNMLRTAQCCCCPGTMTRWVLVCGLVVLYRE